MAIDASVSPDEKLPSDFYSGTTYLGKPTTISVTGSEPSAPGGLGMAASGGATPGPGGGSSTGARVPGVLSVGGTGGGMSGSNNTLGMLLNALGVGENFLKAIRGTRKLTADSPSAPTDASASPDLSGVPFTDPRFPGMEFPTRTPPSTVGASVDPTTGFERLTDPLTGTLPSGSPYTIIETANGPEVVLGAEASAAAGEQGVGGASSAAGAAGSSTSLMPYIGALIDIGMTAAGGKPDYEKAFDSAVDVAAAALAGPTAGLSVVAAPLVKTNFGKQMQYSQEGNWGGFAANADPVLGGINTLSNMFGFDMFGELFGKPKEVDVQVPGYTHPIKQTLSGAKTSLKSFEEGIQGLGQLGAGLSHVETPDALVSFLNQPFSEHEGQTVIHAQRSDGTGVSNVTNANFPSKFTAADLSDPKVLDTLQVYAGAMGAPAAAQGGAEAIRDQIQLVMAAAAGDPQAKAFMQQLRERERATAEAGAASRQAEIDAIGQQGRESALATEFYRTGA